VTAARARGTTWPNAQPRCRCRVRNPFETKTGLAGRPVLGQNGPIRPWLVSPNYRCREDEPPEKGARAAIPATGRRASVVQKSRREPTRKSVYEMQGLVLRLANSVHTSTHWRGAELSSLTPPGDQIADLLTEAGGFSSLLFLRTDPSPWTGAALADGAAVQRALDLVQQMQSDTLPRFFESVKGVIGAKRTSPTRVD
jgi:hypothetical protein